MSTTDFDSLRYYVRELKELGYNSVKRRELICNNSSGSLDDLISKSRTPSHEFKLAGSNFVGAAVFGALAVIIPLEPDLSYTSEFEKYMRTALSAVSVFGAFSCLSGSVKHFYRGIKKSFGKSPKA